MQQHEAVGVRVSRRSLSVPFVAIDGPTGNPRFQRTVVGPLIDSRIRRRMTRPGSRGGSNRLVFHSRRWPGRNTNVAMQDYSSLPNLRTPVAQRELKRWHWRCRARGREKRTKKSAQILFCAEHLAHGGFGTTRSHRAIAYVGDARHRPALEEIHDCARSIDAHVSENDVATVPRHADGHVLLQREIKVGHP